MRKSLAGGVIVVLLLLVLTVSEGLCYSSWSLLTEKEWVPETFGVDFSPNEASVESYFLGASTSLGSRFSGFVGLGVSEGLYPGLDDRRSVLAGFVFSPNPGLSLSLEFEEKGYDNHTGELDEDKMTFRTVITF
jgi:hypothetical protein